MEDAIGQAIARLVSHTAEHGSTSEDDSLLSRLKNARAQGAPRRACSRCRRESPNYTTMLGREFCDACVFSFNRWAEYRPRKLSAERAAYGERIAQSAILIAERGYVTAQLLAELTGRPRSKCNWYLHNAAKGGVLRFEGDGRFVVGPRWALAGEKASDDGSP